MKDHSVHNKSHGYPEVSNYHPSVTSPIWYTNSIKHRHRPLLNSSVAVTVSGVYLQLADDDSTSLSRMEREEGKKE